MTPQQIIIYEWIKDHAPIAVQMSVRPDNIAWLENAVGEALASARAEGMREAARIVTEHYESLSEEHRLLLVNRSTAILSAIGEKP